jgi:hypothetical protein
VFVQYANCEIAPLPPIVPVPGGHPTVVIVKFPVPSVHSGWPVPVTVPAVIKFADGVPIALVSAAPFKVKLGVTTPVPKYPFLTRNVVDPKSYKLSTNGFRKSF